jgi:5-deoxy-glucuronate isomerase
MGLIRGKPDQPGHHSVVGPQDSDLSYISFGLLSLADGESWGHSFADEEVAFVILGGKCDFSAGGEKWENIGERKNVFGGKPTAVYLPPATPFQVTGRGQVEIAVCGALADKGAAPALITPDKVGARQVGQRTFYRDIYDIVVPDSVPAQRLLIGETYNPPGLWSSYPPHKHDVQQPPQETKLEEVYHFRLNPPQGFGLQRVYGDGFDECYAAQDRDTVVITRGYHPLVGAPGYQLYYLWILAGEERVMHPRDDDAHAWAKEAK